MSPPINPVQSRHDRERRSARGHAEQLPEFDRDDRRVADAGAVQGSF